MNWASLLVLFFGSALALSLSVTREEPRILSPAEHWRRALAGLEADDLSLAEIELEKLAMTVGLDQHVHAEFLRGNIAFRRAEKAEILAASPEAGIPELDAAILEAKKASEHWLLVVRRKVEWVVARRNLQRAMEKVVYLETRRELLKAEAKKNKSEQEKETEAEPELIAEDRLIEADLRELPRSAMARILERLAEKQQEKLGMRRAALNERAATGGRDW